jgi:hypothetical protein
VLKSLSISRQEWESVHKKIKDFRDNNAAHLNANNWRQLISVANVAKIILCQGYKIFRTYFGFVAPDLSAEYDKVIGDTNLLIRIAHANPSLRLK